MRGILFIFLRLLYPPAMQDRPTVAELLEAVRQSLVADVVSSPEGTGKFQAGVAAKVLDIVQGELGTEARALAGD